MKNRKLWTNLIVIAIFVTIGFGCKSINIPSLGGGGGVSESTDPKTAVTSAYKKFAEQKSYHSVVKSKNSMAEVTTEVDFIAPDKFLTKNSLPNLKTETIIIGSDAYSQTNGGKWTKMPAGQMPSASDMRGKMMEDSVAAMRDFEAAGKETLNGKETVIFKFKSSYAGESSSKVWIAADSGLPVKVDTEGTFGGTKVEMSTTYDYDKEVKIEAPKVN